MAIYKYLQPNALRIQARNQRRMTLAIGLSLIAISLPLLPLLSIPIAVGTRHLYKRTGRLLSGAVGEEKVLRLLRHIPDRYTLFNNVRVPTDRGFRELDIIIVGENGLIFVIEVKNMRGKIKISNINPRQWRQTWAGKTKTFPSPVHQLQGQVFALKDYLKNKGLPSWIEGAVVFSHRFVDMDDMLTVFPTLLLDDLLTYLQSFDSMRPQPRAHAMIEAIAELVPDKGPGYGLKQTSGKERAA